jgi:hypothetical protein
MPTMNVNLTPEMAQFVSEEIASGDYASAARLVFSRWRRGNRGLPRRA